MKHLIILINTIQLYRIIRRRKIDVIHINNGTYPGVYSTISMVFAARLCGIRRIVFVINNIPEGYHYPLRWLDFYIDRLVFRWVTFFITGSRYVRNSVVHTLKIQDDKVRCIHNGVKPKEITESPDDVKRRLSIPSNRSVFSVIAILKERKGHMCLFKALTELKKENPDIVLPFFVIAGVGPEEKNLQKYVQEHNLDEDISFIGFEFQIFNLINTSDCIVLPSTHNEDFPTVILEAMSLGKAIIASDLSGISEQIEHTVSGILVKPGDIQSLKNAILELEHNPSLQESIGMHAKKRFEENFTDEISVIQYCKLYTALTEKGYRI